MYLRIKRNVYEDTPALKKLADIPRPPLSFSQPCFFGSFCIKAK
jgi:hypothetical protein